MTTSNDKLSSLVIVRQWSDYETERQDSLAVQRSHFLKYCDGSVMHSVKTVEKMHDTEFCSVLPRVAVQGDGAAAPLALVLRVLSTGRVHGSVGGVGTQAGTSHWHASVYGF